MYICLFNIKILIMKKISIILSLLFAIFVINVNAQETKNLTAKFNENFLTYQNNKSIVSFVISGTRSDFQNVITTAKNYKKYLTFSYKNNQNESYTCKMSFDKYDKPVSNFDFIQKMLLNFNIEYFTYKGQTYKVKDFTNAVQK